jgi:hypothetical protein
MKPTPPAAPPLTKTATKSSQSPAGAWHPAWRIGISVLLLLHLTIVIIVPLSMPPPQSPGSPLAQRILGWVRPYVDAFQVSHFYGFFAPNPGPSHLVHYELEMPDGKTVTGEIPDLKRKFPRLLYHRHFMLSEKLANMAPANPPQRPPETAGPEDIKEWEQAYARWELQRDAFQAVARSYARHMQSTTGARSVQLGLVEHAIPGPVAVINGQKLDDPALYMFTPQPIITTSPEDVPPPANTPENVQMPKERP